jgi:tRNA pseudouridine38-40 synthase
VRPGTATPARGEGRPVALVCAYRGAGFAGFQRQAGPRTVQQVLEAALGDLAGRAVAVRGAGRTDAGVHALGQVVDCRLPPSVRMPAARLPLALQARLPADAAAVAAWDVPPDFDARFSALSKRYRYLIWRDPVASPFWRDCAWHRAGPLDVAAMAEAARALAGRHDFAAFAGSARPVADATRTVLECTVRSAPPWLAIDVEADGFLYRMVRAIAGTLVEVGRGALRPADVPRILAEGRRAEAGPSLPPWGLCLLHVRYPRRFGLPPAAPAPWPPGGPFLTAGVSGRKVYRLSFRKE